MFRLQANGLCRDQGAPCQGAITSVQCVAFLCERVVQAHHHAPATTPCIARSLATEHLARRRRHVQERSEGWLAHPRILSLFGMEHCHGQRTWLAPFLPNHICIKCTARKAAASSSCLWGLPRCIPGICEYFGSLT